MQLSKRMSAVAGLVTPGHRVADIGTDHAWVPIELVSSGKCPEAIAMDVRTGPLQAAREHITSMGLADRIQIRLSDGLTCLKPGEAEAIIIAGMGGALMERILTEGAQTARAARELILQPQSELMAFRQFLAREGYHITDEDMILEEGKFYPLMRVVYQAGKRMVLTEEEAAYGPMLLASRNEILAKWLEIEKGRFEKILSSLGEARGEAAARKAEVEASLERNRRCACRLKT